MWKHLFWFEVRYWLRSWMLWIFLIVISAMVFGAVSSDQVQIGGALENTYRNAPFVIQNYYALMCLLTLLMTTAFVNSAAARDFALNTHEMVFSTPLGKLDFLTGRYLGSALISLVPVLGVSVGVLLAKYMPWVDPERWGPVDWRAHFYGIVVFAIPNTLFIAAIIFAIAALTRSTITSFLGSLLLLTGYGVAQALTTDLRNEKVAMLIDPFAIRTFYLVTKYWTVADKNRLSVDFGGMLLWNRLIWLAAGAGVFAFACARFTFAEKSSRRRKGAVAEEERPVESAAVLPPARPSGGRAASLAQFWGSLTIELRGLVKTTSFIVITAAALLNTIPSLILSTSEGYGNASLPVTYQMIEIVQGSLYFFLIAMITYYAGVLVWKDRDTGMDEIHDALPHPVWPGYAAKLGALVGAIFLIQCVAMASGILLQAFHGYQRYQLGLYTSEMLVMDFSLFVFLAVLAFFIHVLAPNKYAGYFVYIAFLIANAFAWRPLHVASLMVRFASRPDHTYSDMFGYAPYLKGWIWFTVYWGLFCGLMVVATIMLWQRGRETAWAHRLRLARLRFTGVTRPLTAGCAIAFVGVGGWVFYNTKILNTIVTQNDRQNRQADYEKTYKRYQGLLQPRVTAVRYSIDLQPETRNMTMRGDQVIQNEGSQPIPEIHISVAPNFDTEVDLGGASLTTDDKRLYYRIYRLASPMEPGESRPMRFTVRSHTRGFENEVSDLQLVQNGTFFNNSIAPQIGYQPGNELEDRNARKKRGLREKDTMPALERNCTEDCRNTYLSNNSDWVSVESTISTAPDQIAIGPGSLVREWTQNGRRYFQYKLDHDSMNFYSFLSARYAVARTQWNGIRIEVYYDKDHPWNVTKMLRSVERSFEYYTKNFGPYFHKEARIIEFPRVGRFAQAFPGTMPYSEGIGFIADLKNPDDIDTVFYVVAHEMAHQWWAHQAIGANMQGATLLSETLAQYSALMVMEKEYGRDAMRKFLQYEMDNYLRSRGRELLKERPLLTVEAGQGYIHYRKGSVVMYYLKEMIGEEAVNRALRKVLAQYRYAPPPYPTSYALVDALREQTPPQFEYLIKDLFEDITLFSNRTLSARAKKRADGKYDVTIDVESKKFKADAKGNEREVPVDDWIEIGALAKPPKGRKLGKILYRERVHMTGGKHTYAFTVGELPDRAGIDPLYLLIDRVPDDNLKKVDVGG